MTGFPQRFYTLSKRILQNKFVPFLIEKFKLSHIDKGVIKRVEKLPGVVRVHPEELAKLLPGVGNAIIHTNSTEHLQNNEPVLGPIEPS